MTVIFDCCVLGARTAQGIVDSAMSQVKTLVNARLSGKSSGGGSSGGGGSRGSVSYM